MTQIASAAISSSGAKGAASTLSKAGQKASAAELAQYEKSRAALLPYTQGGQQASFKLQNLLGLRDTQDSDQYWGQDWNNLLADGKNSYLYINDPTFRAGYDKAEASGNLNQIGLMSAINSLSDTSQDGSLLRPFSMADYEADPGYQFRLDEGNKALERTQAARGGLLSGAALKAASAYNSGMASQEYANSYDRYNTNQNNIYNRLTGTQNTGLSAQNSVAGLGANAVGSSNDYLTSAASAKAAGQVGAANAWSTGLNNTIGGAIRGGFGF